MIPLQDGQTEEHRSGVAERPAARPHAGARISGAAAGADVAILYGPGDCAGLSESVSEHHYCVQLLFFDVPGTGGAFGTVSTRPIE